jgi:hypothetical protein
MYISGDIPDSSSKPSCGLVDANCGRTAEKVFPKPFGAFQKPSLTSVAAIRPAKYGDTGSVDPDSFTTFDAKRRIERAAAPLAARNSVPSEVSALNEPVGNATWATTD